MDTSLKTYTLTLSKPKVQDFICGLTELEVIRQTKKYEKEGFTVTKQEERPYKRA